MNRRSFLSLGVVSSLPIPLRARPKSWIESMDWLNDSDFVQLHLVYGSTPSGLHAVASVMVDELTKLGKKPTIVTELPSATSSTNDIVIFDGCEPATALFPNTSIFFYMKPVCRLPLAVHADSSSYLVRPSFGLMSRATTVTHATFNDNDVFLKQSKNRYGTLKNTQFRFDPIRFKKGAYNETLFQN